LPALKIRLPPRVEIGKIDQITSNNPATYYDIGSIMTKSLLSEPTESETQLPSYEHVTEQIKTAYEQLKTSSGFRERWAQKQMIGTLAREFNKASDTYIPLCAIEAGTGTGKTYGYCLPLIATAKAANKKLIIATGTVALQEQLVHHDLPSLKALTGMTFSFGLAKGRRRYLCPLRLVNANARVQTGLFEQNDNFDFYALQITNALSAGWEGDFDELTIALPITIQTALSTDSAGCSNKRCNHFEACPYMKAKAKLLASDVIVANHALLIADLKLGGGAVLPAPNASFHVIDEGHRLSSEVLSHTASSHLLHGAQAWLESLIKVAHAMGSHGNEAYQDKISNWDAKIVHDAGVLKERLQTLYAALVHNPEYHPTTATVNARFQRKDEPHITRFELGVVPDWLIEAGNHIKPLSESLYHATTKVINISNETYSQSPNDALLKQAADVGFMRERLDNMLTTWSLLLSTPASDIAPHAKWIEYRKKGETIDFMVAASPTEAKTFLTEHLWQKTAGAAITSATLTALGSFDYFFKQTGLSAETTCSLRLASPFDFKNQAKLYIPKMVEPSHPEHTPAIIEWLKKNLDANESTLMLFTSNKQMQTVYDALCDHYHINMQGQAPKNTLIENHKARRDEGNGGLLMGLDSFGEGLNLSGNYCTHVIIAKLPFPVPSSPVEQAQSEYLESIGGNPFMEISVPLTSAKLTQWVGRLLRTEDDCGKISILDYRLNAKRYGKQMLSALPPFSVVIE
jgi:ATP-dependent DNA helicase DinG